MTDPISNQPIVPVPATPSDANTAAEPVNTEGDTQAEADQRTITDTDFYTEVAARLKQYKKLAEDLGKSPAGKASVVKLGSGAGFRLGSYPGKVRHSKTTESEAPAKYVLENPPESSSTPNGQPVIDPYAGSGGTKPVPSSNINVPQSPTDMVGGTKTETVLRNGTVPFGTFRYDPLTATITPWLNHSWFTVQGAAFLELGGVGGNDKKFAFMTGIEAGVDLKFGENTGWGAKAAITGGGAYIGEGKGFVGGLVLIGYSPESVDVDIEAGFQGSSAGDLTFAARAKLPQLYYKSPSKLDKIKRELKAFEDVVGKLSTGHQDIKKQKTTYDEIMMSNKTPQDKYAALSALATAVMKVKEKVDKSYDKVMDTTDIGILAPQKAVIENKVQGLLKNIQVEMEKLQKQIEAAKEPADPAPEPEPADPAPAPEPADPTPAPEPVIEIFDD